MVGINQSILKHMEKSPAHVFHAMSAPKTKPSEAMIVGCVVESMLFGTPYEYTTSPFDDFRTKEARAWRDEQVERGVHIVTQDLVSKANAMLDSLRQNTQIMHWVKKATNNIALCGQAPNGVDMKGLVDLAPDDELVILDLKTTKDASPRGFGKSIAEYGYDVQAWWYQYLWEQATNQKRQFAFLCVESEAPYLTAIYVIPQENIDRAGQVVQGWLETYRKCKEEGQWPGYSQDLQWAQVPKWRFAYE